MGIQGGMTSYEVLRSATRNAAEALGLGTTTGPQLGVVAAGAIADLLVWPADRSPLVDIRNTAAVAYIIKDGRLFLVRPQSCAHDYCFKSSTFRGFGPRGPPWSPGGQDGRALPDGAAAAAWAGAGHACHRRCHRPGPHRAVKTGRPPNAFFKRGRRRAPPFRRSLAAPNVFARCSLVSFVFLF